MAKNRLLTPGPVSVPERVALAMAEPPVHHRAHAFAPLFREVQAGLRQIFQTEQDVLVLTCSGSGGMEATVASLVARGDKVLVVRGGKFGERWAELVQIYGGEPVCIDVEWGQAVDPERVREVLAAEPEIRALFVQASETSTGAFHPIRELAEIARERDDLLLIVDGISGVGVHDLPMDAWGIDVLISGSQKSFMIPPGLAFVALSPRALASLDRATGPRFYFDLRREVSAQAAGGTAFSTGVTLLRGLRESLRMILEEGLENVYARQARTAAAVRAAIRALDLELFAPDSPSFAATSVRVPEGIAADELLGQLRDRHGVTLAEGQGPVAGKIFRIGHIGWVDDLDMLAAIGALELSLADLGYPIKLGEGARALLERLREPNTDRS